MKSFFCCSTDAKIVFLSAFIVHIICLLASKMLMFFFCNVSDSSDSCPKQSFRKATSATKFSIERILAKPLNFCLSMSFMLGSSDSFLKCAYTAGQSFYNALTARNEEATHRIVKSFPTFFYFNVNFPRNAF